jgi:hypothetical protein
MLNAQQSALVSRLCDAARAGGGWGYSPATAPAAEPTALATIALDAIRDESAGALARSGSAWLAEQQRADGAVNVVAGLHQAAWTTSLAVLAWRLVDFRTRGENIARAVDWLTRARGLTGDVRLSDGQHDASIVGWSWVENTHSWVEPTAYAVMALRVCGSPEHTRTRDGLRLLRDRAIPSGGWNYGNSQVLANMLRPFPETTGVVLSALAGLERDSMIERALTFLKHELPRIRTPLALGWGLIGLHAWGVRPAESAAWLSEAVAQSNERPANPHHDALLLLASLDRPLGAA